MRKYIFHSIKGTSHSENEDNLLIIEEKDYQLFFVFDGVSSAENSNASIKMAQDFILSNFQHYFINSEYNLIDLMYDVNKDIVNSGFANALTTYCVIFFPEGDKECIKFSNLGDSRIYSMTKQYIEKLSVDDNLYSGSSVITKCLGINSLKKSDFREETINVDDKRFLLCTDGFYIFLEEDKDRIFKFLNRTYLGPVKKNIEKIIDGRNNDDATYILIV